MEKIKNVQLQLSSNGNRMTGEIERQRLQSEKSEQINCTLVIFRFVRLNSCMPRQLGLPVRKTDSSGSAVFTQIQCNVKSQTV